MITLYTMPSVGAGSWPADPTRPKYAHLMGSRWRVHARQPGQFTLRCLSGDEDRQALELQADVQITEVPDHAVPAAQSSHAGMFKPGA